MDYSTFSIDQYVKSIKAKKFSVTDAMSFFVDKCKKDTKNAIREIFDSWKDGAKFLDNKIKNNEKLGKLAGVPIIIKDNILYANHGANAGGKMLENFVSPYSSTVVQKLLDADAVIIARANMDEFALGSSGKKSAYGIVKNAHSDDHIAGGTSSGSAVAVATGLCLASIGTDTGGSIRMPASYNGVVGIKSTYGRVSRYGVVGAASGLDTIGVFARNTDDAKIVLDVISGKDQRDMMTQDFPLQVSNSAGDAPSCSDEISNNTIPHTNFDKTIDVKNLKIGRIRRITELYKDSQYFSKFESIFSNLEKMGAKIIDIDLETNGKATNTYYAVNIGQIASNMARYGNVRYGKESRDDHFADEVKRRILFGNHILANDKDGDSLYRVGRRMQKQIEQEFAKAFSKTDIIITPTTYSEACRIDDDSEDPVKEYANDLFTVLASLAGLPAVSVPYDTGKRGLPLGLQIIANKGNEAILFEVAKLIEVQK